jgi:hypothetical protein
MAGLVLACLMLASCRGRGAPPESGPAAIVADVQRLDPPRAPAAADTGTPEASPPETAAPPAAPAAAPTTCVTELPATEQLPLYDGVMIGEAAGLTWLHAQLFRPPGEPQPVLVSLAADGTVATTPLPFRPLAACADGSELRLFRSTSDSLRFRWRTVDVSNVDAPVLAAETSLAGIAPHAGIDHARCGGERVLVSYRLYEPGESTGRATTVVLDAGTGEATTTLDGASSWGGGCTGSSCFVLGHRAGVDPASTVFRIAPDGATETYPASGEGGCAAQVVEGEELRVVVGSGADRWLGAVIDADLTVSTLEPAADAPLPAGCRLEPLPGRFGGLLEELDGRYLLHRWDAASRRFGGTEPFPRSNRWLHRFLPTGGELVEVAWDNSSGMTHSPTDESGRRRYYEAWRFEGGALRLLRRADGGWTEAATIPLAAAPAEGTTHRGYEAFLLRRGERISVVLIPGGPSVPAVRQSFLGSCPP